MTHRNKLDAAVLALIVTALPAHAQDRDGFDFGGESSFDQADAPATGGVATPSEDAFGGSFTDSGRGQGDDEAEPDDGGTASGGDFGGSFGEGSFAEPDNTAQGNDSDADGSTAGETSGGGDFSGSSFPPGGHPPPVNGPITGNETGTGDPAGGDFNGSFGPSTLPGATPPVTPPAITGTTPATPPPVNPPPPPDPVTAFEMQDFGVAPTDQIRRGPPHAPTPTQIPGGRVIGTAELRPLVANNQVLLIDVLGGGQTLPNAIDAAGMGSPGDYPDQTQPQAEQFLNQVTRGNNQAPLVMFCSDPMCWLSYNAALRAIHAGYQQVMWYRGGLAAWQQGGNDLVAHGGYR